jgi:lipopolysaccharide transport protein LptA
MKKLLPLLLCLALGAAGDPDGPPARKGDLHIESDSFEHDGPSRTVKFIGNVTVVDPPSKPGEFETRLTCQTLTVKRSEAEGRIESIVADGAVDIVQGPNRAQGAKAVYNALTEIVELTGDPVLTMPQGNLRSPVVILDRKNNKLRALGSPGNRVTMELKQDAIGKPEQGLLGVNPKGTGDGKPKP